MSIRRALAATALAAIAFATMVGGAIAQVPASAGGLSCVSGPFDTQSGRRVDVSAVLRDADGKALPGGLVFFEIVSQVGDDAVLSSPFSAADGSGRAFVSLTGGSTSGPLLVLASTEDGQQCLTNVEVAGATSIARAGSGTTAHGDTFRRIGLLGVLAGIVLVGLRGFQTVGPRRASRA